MAVAAIQLTEHQPWADLAWSLRVLIGSLCTLGRPAESLSPPQGQMSIPPSVIQPLESSAFSAVLYWRMTGTEIEPWRSHGVPPDIVPLVFPPDNSVTTLSLLALPR